MIELMNGDCLEKMKEIPDKSVDLILCDLPYGVTANKLDIVIPFEPLWGEYDRITKDNSAILLFAQGMFYVDLVNSNRKIFKYDLIWDKELTTGFLNAKKMPLRKHEQIAVFYKKQPVYNPQMTKGSPNHFRKEDNEETKGNKNYGKYNRVKQTYDGMKYPTSILEFSKPHPSAALHRTEKSIQLLEYLIKTYSNENQIVLDNCMGSGTTGVACVNTNRSFIGIELDKEYFDISCKRIKEALPMFNKKDLMIHN